MCNSLANCSFFKISLLTPPLLDFLSKNLKTVEARPLWYPSYFEILAKLNALSLKTLSEAVLLLNL